MSKTVTGFCFVKDAIKYDYCWQEAIQSMLGACDKVLIVEVGSTDGTRESLERWEKINERLKVLYYPVELWDSLHGKTKLAHFQNLAIDHIHTDYQFLCQADEVISETSYKAIREAMESGKEGFMCTRLNLWRDPYTELNVPQNRMPCSPQVIRLTKRGYLTYDDGESIGSIASMQYVEQIKLFHMGFVRRREVMKDKIINMQRDVFEITPDSKLDEMDVFDWRAWFSETDLKPLSEPLPVVVQGWALAREY